MLVTHCPECKTAFRVTEAILDQAGGQVRCGRCSHVFNGIEDLSEQPEAATRRIEPFLVTATTPDPEPEYDGGGTNWFLTDGPVGEPEPKPETDTARESAAAAAPEPAAAPEVEPATQVEPAAEIEPAAVVVPAFENEPEFVVEPAQAKDDDPVDPDWLPPLDETPRRTWPWATAAVVLILCFAAQLVHAFRADLAGVAGIGSPLQGLYSRLGREITPRVDLAAYELVDIAFTTGTAADGQPGWLIIEARLRNKGPDAQPFPQVFVALKDRWRRTVAGRYFEPEEYAVTPYASYARMPVGVVLDAQLIIADPGPEVTEYELQLCTRSGQGFLCDGDSIFE
jgi:predicted Zn finger-like uncharacterized protein